MCTFVCICVLGVSGGFNRGRGGLQRPLAREGLRQHPYRVSALWVMQVQGQIKGGRQVLWVMETAAALPCPTHLEGLSGGSPRLRACSPGKGKEAAPGPDCGPELGHLCSGSASL